MKVTIGWPLGRKLTPTAEAIQAESLYVYRAPETTVQSPVRVFAPVRANVEGPMAPVRRVPIDTTTGTSAIRTMVDRLVQDMAPTASSPADFQSQRVSDYDFTGAALPPDYVPPPRSSQGRFPGPDALAQATALTYIRQPTREEVEGTSCGPASFPVWDRDQFTFKPRSYAEGYQAPPMILLSHDWIRIGLAILAEQIAYWAGPWDQGNLTVDQRSALSALYGEAQADGVFLAGLRDLAADLDMLDSWAEVELWAGAYGNEYPRRQAYAQRALDIRAGK